MLSDRSYMRSLTGRSTPGFLLWFLGALVAVFVLQNVATTWFGSDVFFDFGALRQDGVRAGYIWTFLSYVLLHGSITHLLFNCLGIYFIGKALESELGSSRVAQLSVFSAFVGGIAWLAVNFSRDGILIGASGIAMAYLAVFACLYPRRQMTILLFFVIPVTVQPIWLVTILGAIDLIGLLFQELPHTRTLYGVAHSAHLGGLAAGWIFLSTPHRAPHRFGCRRDRAAGMVSAQGAPRNQVHRQHGRAAFAEKQCLERAGRLRLYVQSGPTARRGGSDPG